MIWDVDQYLILDNVETINWKPRPYRMYRPLVKNPEELAILNDKHDKRVAYQRAYDLKRRQRGAKG